MLLGVSPAQASCLFIFVSLAGFVGRFVFSGLSELSLLRAFRADRLRIAPRETSGTEGSNLSSSGKESCANLVPLQRLSGPPHCR